MFLFHLYKDPYGVFEPSVADHAKERLLIWELTDRFHQILIAVRVIGDQLPHARDDIEGIKVVGLLHHVIRDLAELQHHQPPARFQHAVGFFQCFLRSRHIPDAKADRVEVICVVLKRQHHRVAHNPF